MDSNLKGTYEHAIIRLVRYILLYIILINKVSEIFIIYYIIKQSILVRYYLL